MSLFLCLFVFEVFWKQNQWSLSQFVICPESIKKLQQSNIIDKTMEFMTINHLKNENKDKKENSSMVLT